MREFHYYSLYFLLPPILLVCLYVIGFLFHPNHLFKATLRWDFFSIPRELFLSLQSGHPHPIIPSERRADGQMTDPPYCVCLMIGLIAVSRFPPWQALPLQPINERARPRPRGCGVRFLPTTKEKGSSRGRKKSYGKEKHFRTD